MSVAASLVRIRAIARRDALIEMSYHFRLVFMMTTALASAFVAYYVARLVGDPEPLRRFDGSYFDYVLIGLALTSYVALGVTSFARQLLHEQAAGTLEALLSGPTRLPTLLAGGLVVPFGLTTVEVAFLIGVGIGVLGSGLTVAGVLVGVPLVALTMVNFCALGVASAAVVLLTKRGDPISGPVLQLTLLLSGAIIPVELFPPWLQVVSRAMPAYYGIRGLREALLTDAGLGGVVDEIAILTGFALVAIPAAVYLFARSVATAKRLGVLASY